MIDLENDKVNNLKRKLFQWLDSETQYYNWRTLCESIRYIIFYVLFVSVTTALAFLPLPVAGAVQQAEGFPGGRTGLQEAGFGPGIHGTTPWTTQPAHFIQNCPVGLTEVY